MGKLILVRHGETDKNSNSKLHGTDDPETLNEIGLNQIKLTTKAIAGLQPSIVYSSTEARALESAKIISESLHILLEPIDGIQERNWGIFTDKPWADVRAVLDPMNLEERYNYMPPQGESWKTFESRLIKAINNISSDNKYKTIVVVTHAGVIRALMPFLLNIPKEESFKYDPNNSSLTIFDFDDKGFHKVSINDTSHLQ
jgi:alpha-ribazole phosphatase